MMALGDEMRQILSVAVQLAGLQAGDFEALRAVAEQAQAWAEALEADIRGLLQSHNATQEYADTYLGGRIAEWFRSLFEVRNEREFLHRQMQIAAEHVRADVPNEVVLALAPRWVEKVMTLAEEAWGAEKARELGLVLMRILNLTAIVMVATHDMLMRRTILKETGFSEALLKRLQTRALQEIVEEMTEEQENEKEHA